MGKFADRRYRSKLFWFDVETSGLDKKRNDITQIGCIIEIDGRVEDEFVWDVKPFGGRESVEKEALEVTGKTLDEVMRSEMTLVKMVRDLKSVFGKYVNKYDRNDKFVALGYNVKFDLDFLRESFLKAGDRYGIGSWLFSAPVDVMSFVGVAIGKYGWRFENYKLETVVRGCGLDIKAHDALEDIQATKRLFEIIGGLR